MFFVGGGIIVHQLHEHVPAVHRLLEEGLADLGIGGSAGWGGLLEKLVEAAAGLALGLLVVGGVSLGRLGGRAFGRAA
jgi:predicted DNA repair protein MutK